MTLPQWPVTVAIGPLVFWMLLLTVKHVIADFVLQNTWMAMGKDANTPVPLRGEPNEKAIGEWNTNVTVCAGNSVKAIINGKLLNEITECTVTNGFIGIQSEGGDIEIRKMFLEPLKN